MQPVTSQSPSTPSEPKMPATISDSLNNGGESKSQSTTASNGVSTKSTANAASVDKALNNLTLGEFPSTKWLELVPREGKDGPALRRHSECLEAQLKEQNKTILELQELVNSQSKTIKNMAALEKKQAALTEEQQTLLRT